MYVFLYRYPYIIYHIPNSQSFDCAQGEFIREFIPELCKMPSAVLSEADTVSMFSWRKVFSPNGSLWLGKYIYAPWTAPMEVGRVGSSP